MQPGGDEISSSGCTFMKGDSDFFFNDLEIVRRLLVKYIIYGFCALVLSSGPVCMAFIFAKEDLDMRLVWMQIPFTLLMVIEMLVTLRVLLPRLFNKGRYLAFGLSVAVVSYFINIAAVWITSFMTDLLKLPIIVKDPFSVWVWVEGLAASVAGVFLLCGLTIWEAYEQSEKQNKKEREIKRVLEEKTRRFKERIRIAEVREKLEEAIRELENNPRRANSKIRDLSDFLRKRLYDKDGRFEAGERIKTKEEEERKHTMDFLIRRKYRWVRHVSLIGAYLVMSTGLFFSEPGKPDVSKESLVYTGIFFLILTGMTYLNIFLIFPLFQKRGKVSLYGWSLFGLSALFCFLSFFTAWKPEGIYNDYGVRVPDFVLFISAVGNMLTFFFIFAGTASILLIKGNVEGKWRVSREESVAARLEFETLQQQVNPHFLFNVLNNAGVLSYDDPAEAAATLRGMKSFLEYMLRESGRKLTSVGEELAFIDNYLTMEKSSGKELKIERRIEEGIEEDKLPPLLLIPFVENAVKYSRQVDGKCFIKIEIGRIEGKLRFVCLNTCGEERGEKTGGLGIANTRRRLDFLYGEDYRLASWRIGEEYRVELTIPDKI